MKSHLLVIAGGVIAILLEWLILKLPRKIKKRKQAEAELQNRKQSKLRDTQANIRNRFHNWFLAWEFPIDLTFQRIDHADETTSDLTVRRSNGMLVVDVVVNLSCHHKEEQIHVRFYGNGGKLRDEAFPGDDDGFADATRFINAMMRYVILAEKENS